MHRIGPVRALHPHIRTALETLIDTIAKAMNQGAAREKTA
jgi:hypothetical protein